MSKFVITKPTGYIRPETSGSRRTITVLSSRPTQISELNDVIVSIQLNSVPTKGTAIFLTAEEAEDLAVALQFYARGHA